MGESYVAVRSWNKGIVAAWSSADARKDDIVVQLVVGGRAGAVGAAHGL